MGTLSMKRPPSSLMDTLATMLSGAGNRKGTREDMPDAPFPTLNTNPPNTSETGASEPAEIPMSEEKADGQE